MVGKGLYIKMNVSELEKKIGEKLTKILLELSKKYPEDFKKEIWDKILGSDISTQEQSRKILEWCLEKLSNKEKGSE